MNGVEYKKIGIAHEDGRRRLIEVSNGDFISKQIKLIEVKDKSMVLGNHYHPFGQFFYLLRGKAYYTFENVDTKERIEYEMNEGDRITIAPRIAHKGLFLENNCMTLEGNEEPYTGTHCDIAYEVK